MATPLDIVTDFLSRWGKPGGFAEAVRDYFTPETVWENVGMSKTTGPEQAMALYDGMGAANPAAAGAPLIMRVDTLALAVTGDKVLTERIDHILGPDGQPAMSFPLMGAFEVKGGKIVAWRDYFDTAGFAQQGQG